MNNLYEELVERIRGEVPDLDRLVQRSLLAWAQVQKSPNEKEIYLDY